MNVFSGAKPAVQPNESLVQTFPKEAGVPTSYDLTQSIANEFRQRPQHDKYAKVVSFVLGGLLFNRGIQGDDPLNCGVNVEEFFNAIELLADRNSLDATAFVGSWHSMVEEFDKIQPPPPHGDKLYEIIFKSVTDKIFTSIPNRLPSFGANDIDRKLDAEIRGSVEAAVKGRAVRTSANGSIGREVGDFVMEIMRNWMGNLRQNRPSGYEFQAEFQRSINQQPRPGEGKIFREVANLMIKMLVRLVFVKDKEKVAYLSPLKILQANQKRLAIASLNYDNCVETFCEGAGIRCETGIEEWSQAGSFDMQDDGILLLKLHGSIDWQSKDTRSKERPMPHLMITRASVEEVGKSSYRPAVIFGHRNKLTADGPFLDLLRAFQRELTGVDRLTVVGYSFADVHINVYLSHWLNNSSRHRLRIVDPMFGARPCPYAQDLIRHAKVQVEVIKEPAGKALQSLFGTPVEST